jgi:hypothetical protein
VPSVDALDRVLTAQLAVAWAGEGAEGGEDARLGWWRTDLASELGGEDLFRRLLPATWRWAVLEAAREAARRVDHGLRRREHDPDRLVTLFHLGFELDERLAERLLALKCAGRAPEAALPGLAGVVGPVWDRAAFAAWLGAQGEAEASVVPSGRLLAGAPPAEPVRRVRALTAALLPLADRYPLPHFRREA